jgi:TolB-like protein
MYLDSLNKEKMYEKGDVYMNVARRALVLSRVLLAGLLFMAFTAGAYAQNGERLGKIAILPFSGGSADEREGIAELFSGTREMMGSFGVIPRTTIINAVQQEQAFQALSGMTNADTIAKLGNQFGADYVVAGSITSLGSRHLLIVSIIKIDVIQQVAGDFLVYDTLDALNNNETLVNTMAANLVKMLRNTKDGLDKLALLPVQFAGGANAQEGDALAQLLAIYLLRGGKYAVYPRTKTLEQVQSEYETQLSSGVTRVDEVVIAGKAVNPPYVLSVVSRKIGSGTRFNASIIELEEGLQINAGNEQYANLSDGINAMELLARELSGKMVSEKDRAKRTVIVDKEKESAEKAAADRLKAEKRTAADRLKAAKRAAATDKFLKNSGVDIGGWSGVALVSEKNVEYKDGYGYETEDDTVFFNGGVNIELRYNWFGIQTGLNVLGDHAPYKPQGEAKQYAKLTVLQVPVLARFSFRAWVPDTMGVQIAGFAGVGMNVATTSDAESAGRSLIVGGELGFIGQHIGTFIGYQWNGDMGSSSITVDGAKYDYTRGNHIVRFGVSYFLPFRRK